MPATHLRRDLSHNAGVQCRVRAQDGHEEAERAALPDTVLLQEVGDQQMEGATLPGYLYAPKVLDSDNLNWGQNLDMFLDLEMFP